MSIEREDRVLTPDTVDELLEVVRATPRVLAVGGRTKPRLSDVDATHVSLRRLNGIVEYEPGEFTFTAQAGTPVGEIAQALARERQHLPFDPMLAAAGSTIGGAVATGLNGPGRLRYGGLRDFILGVRFVDGEGRLLRLGGKVVKNAAGFDVPKFLVGSLGRFGILTEVTFKVFPVPPTVRTVEFPVADDEAAIRLLQEVPLGRWEPRALDYDPDSRRVHLQVGGPENALDSICQEVLTRWTGRTVDAAEAQQIWADRRELAWADPDGALLKAVFDPRKLRQMDSIRRVAPGARWRLSSAGDVALISLPPEVDWRLLGEVLRGLSLPALSLRGTGPLRPGVAGDFQIARLVKRVMDPSDRFPGIDE